MLAEAANTFGEIRLFQANFAGARDRFQEALSLREALGDQLGLAETRASTAELRMAEGKPQEAEKLLNQALAEFRKASSQDQEITTVGDLAHALLDQGKTAEALKAINSVRARALVADNQFVRSDFLIAAARADALSGGTAKAKATLENVLQVANTHGFVGIQLKARLALAEIERKKDRAKGDMLMAEVRKNAVSRGFLLIAKQAAQN